MINCTGVLASKLGGVEDDKVVPMKGQLVLVRNESHGLFSIGGEGYAPVGEYCYIMNRPFGTSPHAKLRMNADDVIAHQVEEQFWADRRMRAGIRR